MAIRVAINGFGRIGRLTFRHIFGVEGFEVVAINGHDFDEIENALNVARDTKGKPTAIVMSTTKGKGVSYMENNAGWHGKAPNDAEYAQAMSELKAQLAELEA